MISRELKKNRTKYEINQLLLRKATQTQVSMTMTIDLANILDRICPLKTLEMAFQLEHQDFQSFWGSMTPHAPSG